MMKSCPVCQSVMHELGGLWICDFCRHEEPVQPVRGFYEAVADELY